MSVIIVTGLGCSGKSTYADSLSTDTTRVVHTDTLKFHAGWQRHPPNTYLANLRAHVNPDSPDVETVFEGLYHDPSASCAPLSVSSLRPNSWLPWSASSRRPRHWSRHAPADPLV